jgi:hypothetical protein
MMSATDPGGKRRALALHRERIIDKLTDLAVIADLRRRLAEAERARLRAGVVVYTRGVKMIWIARAQTAALGDLG